MVSSSVGLVSSVRFLLILHRISLDRRSTFLCTVHRFHGHAAADPFFKPLLGLLSEPQIVLRHGRIDCRMGGDVLEQEREEGLRYTVTGSSCSFFVDVDGRIVRSLMVESAVGIIVLVGCQSSVLL